MMDRRPILVRGNQWSQWLTNFLVRRNVAPNKISVASVIYGLSAGIILAVMSLSTIPRVWWALAAILILWRLLTNMLDGMVAVATGKTSLLGELFNELPDRISDAAIFIGAGFANGGTPDVGYVTAVLALLTAYVRTLGNQMGVQKLFMGPMAKSHRMFTLVALCLYMALTPTSWQPPLLTTWVLLLIAMGSFVTILRRLRHIVKSIQND